MKRIKTLALVAPSGNIRNIDAVNNNIATLKKYFKVKKYYDENAQFRYLADCDENRARYFEKAFLDDEVDLVLSVRGGYGAIRIVDKINYNLVKNCSKYYLGSSDASILLMALTKKTKIKCFHSLMLMNGFVDNLDENINIVQNNIFDINLKPIIKKQTKGILWGGNLSSIVSRLSNDRYLPDKDIVLFLEDLNEPLYKIDKMFYEIYRSEKLKSKIKGLIFGDFYLADDEIMPLFEEFGALFNCGVYYSKDITHKITNKTIPYGIKIEI